MGLMSQKDLATEGAERINSFLDQQEEDTTVQEEDALNTEFDEEGEYLEGLQDKYLVTGSDGQEWSDTPYLDEGLKDPMAEVAMFTPILGDAIEATIAAQEAMEGNWWSSAANLAGVVPIAGPTIKKAMKKYKAPKKTALGYKLFRTDPDQPGELFPLFVDGKSAVPIGEWVTSADVYNFTAANGRKYVPATTGDSIPIPNDTVRKELLDNGFSKKPNNKAIKAVAYRPGFHAGDTPSSQHIGGQSTGAKKPDHRQPNQVWAEVEMPDDVDWQTIANANATRNKNGSIQARTAEVTEGIPHGGFYRYKTNANMVGNWMIGGAVKVNRVLSDIEVKKINDKAGVSDLPRLKPRADGGDSVPKDTGNIPKFNQGGLVEEQDAILLNEGGDVGQNKEKSVWDILREVSKSEVTRYEPSKPQEEEWKPKPNEGMKDFVRGTSDKVQGFLGYFVDGEEDEVEEVAPVPVTTTNLRLDAKNKVRQANPKPKLKEVDIQTNMALEESLVSTSPDANITSQIHGIIKHVENGIRLNWSKESGKWTPHDSEEGGLPTIAYGHKIKSQSELDDIIASGGVTEEEAISLFNSDMADAESKARSAYEKEYVGRKWDSLDKLGKLMLTEIVFNVGSLAKSGEYFWPYLTKAIHNKDYTEASGQLNRTYTMKNGKKKSLRDRTDQLKSVYESLLNEAGWPDTEAENTQAYVDKTDWENMIN